MNSSTNCPMGGETMMPSPRDSVASTWLARVINSSGVRAAASSSRINAWSSELSSGLFIACCAKKR